MAKQAKTATELGRRCEWSRCSNPQPLLALKALQESTPNVTVGNAVSALLDDKGKPQQVCPFFLERKIEHLPTRQAAIVREPLIDLHPRNGPGLAPFRTLTQFMQVIYSSFGCGLCLWSTRGCILFLRSQGCTLVIWFIEFPFPGVQ